MTDTSMPLKCWLRTDPWPQLAEWNCSICDAPYECWIQISSDKANPLFDKTTRTRMAVKAVASSGWLLFRSKKGELSWVCRKCIECLDSTDSNFRAAVKQSEQWRSIDFVIVTEAA